jgi:hypothetical protein
MLTMGVVRGISYGLFGPPDDFGPAARRLNAGLVRAYVYWNQVEPEPGRLDWTSVDRLLEQVADGGRLWITVCSSSSWATRTPATFLPPSPPLDPAAYGRFVAELVRRCGERVLHWQCENEPSNAGLLWAGTAEEYAALLTTFAEAVRSVPGAGHVVLGGIGYDALSTEQGSEQWDFFDTVCSGAGSAFDLVDVHLYDDPRRITGHLAAVRELLDRNGCDQPLVVGEYGGPTFFEFPAAEQAVQAAMMAAFAPGATPLEQDSAGPDETPDRRAMRRLYEQLAELPAELQQFLDGCPPDVAARRDRIACRELVTRNVIVFAEGITTTCYWDLAPEIPDYSDPYNLLGLVSARLALLDFRDGELVDAQPAAGTFRMLAEALAGATAVRRITDGLATGVHAYAVDFGGSPKALQIVWREADPFVGDEDAPTALDWHWPHHDLHAADALASALELTRSGDRVTVPLSATPVLLSSTPLATVG